MSSSLMRFAARLARGDFLIRDRNSQRVVPLNPNQAQLRLLRAMFNQADAGRPIRVLVPKSRKRGVSTFVQAWQYHLAQERGNFNALTAAHRREDTEEIFTIARRFHERFYGEKVRGTTKLIRFPNSDSKYRCMTAMGNFGGSGSDTHALHISEAALIENKSGQDAENLAAMINSMPQGSAETSLIMESTGMGPHGLFAALCMAAERGGTDYELVFIPWTDDPDLSDPDHPDDLDSFNPPLTRYERQLAADLNATPAQLSWRRRKIRNDHPEWSITSEGNPPLFGYHYPAYLRECFSSVSGAVFPGFSRNKHIGALTVTREWERYRAIDWGWTGDHAFVCLWVAHHPGFPPGLRFDPSVPEEVIDEFVTYAYDPRTGRPRKEHDHGPDALRYVVCTYKLTGLLYVYRALWMKGAAAQGPTGMARMIHEMSGWKLPAGADENNLSSYYPGPDGEQYVGTVADRSQQGLIKQFCDWGLPTIAHGKPHPRDSSMGEVMDGISDLAVFMTGDVRFSPLPVNTEDNLIRSAIAKSMMRRELALTDEEEAAMERLGRDRAVFRAEHDPDTTLGVIEEEWT